MDINDFITELSNRIGSIEDLEHLARSIQAGPDILGALESRRREVEALRELAEEVNGSPRDLDPTDVVPIRTSAELAAFAHARALRPDWHEPDEQKVNAFVQGAHLDNAMGSCADTSATCGELNVVITYDEKPVAVVNLAHLLAWAASENRP